jgi:transposase
VLRTSISNDQKRDMKRHALTDEQWARLQPIVNASRTGPRSKLGDRLFVDAVVYRMTTGVPWRDLPEHFGPWNRVYKRFSAWSKRGAWAKILKALQLKVDRKSCIVDASVVRAHQDASGGKGGSKAMLWGTLAGASLPSYTQLPMQRAALSSSH